MPSPMTHDGHLTVTNPETGNHVLLHVGTQQPDAKFAAGRRILSLVEGQGRGKRTSFAFVERSRVWPWAKYRGPGREKWETYARMVEAPAAYDGRVTFHFEARCRVCGRVLTDPESIELGIGPTCRGGGR